MSVTEIIDNIIAQLNELKERLKPEADKEFNEPEPRSRSNILNKSKFLNEEQRDQLMEIVKDNELKQELTKLPDHKQIAFLRQELKQKYNINISFYMAQKIIKQYFT